MSDIYLSTRWNLPLLAVGQMQKEVTHNEALTLIDMLLAPIVEAVNVNSPPAAPGHGQCWLIGASPVGLWAGKAQHLACWTHGGWRYAAPKFGTNVTLSDGRVMRFDGDSWKLPPIVTAPQGGSVADSEARAAINGLIAALRSQGWLSGAS